MTDVALPEVLQSVTLVLRPARDDDRALEVGTKVIDLEVTRDGPTIVVSRQPGVDGLTRAPHVELAWLGPSGPIGFPVALSSARRDYGPVWLARPIGPAVRTQRRAFFRASMYAPVRVDWTEDVDGGEPVDRRADGVTVDLSEGGMLAAFRDAWPPSGTEVTVAVVVDGDRLEQLGVVLRQVELTGGGTGLAVAFADPARHGDRLRRAAFEAERRQLRAASGRPEPAA